MDRDAILEVRSVCREVLVAPHVQEYAIQLVMATQPEQKEAHELARKYVRYGSSPRGAQALVECGRVLRPDARALPPGDGRHPARGAAVLRHRIILNFDAHADGQTPETILHRHYQGRNRAGIRRVGTVWRAAPLLDREFLEKLERLTIHWQKSFCRPGGRAQHVALCGRRPGVSRPSQFPSRRRSARRQLARLPAPGEAVPEDVPGGAARAGAPAGGYSAIPWCAHGGSEVRLRAQAGGRAVLRRPGAARHHRDSRISPTAWRSASFPPAAGTASPE